MPWRRDDNLDDQRNSPRALGHHRAGRDRPGLSAAGSTARSTGKLVAIGTRNPKKAGPRRGVSRAPASSTATRRCSTIRRSRPSTSRRRIRAMPSGRSRRPRPASTCSSKSRWRSSAFEVDAVFHAHRKAGTFAGEAFMYRLHPQTAKLGELIASGAIGEVRMIQSSFGFQMPQLHARAPALRQRSRRRRHPRCRRLSGLDGALHRRRRRRQALPRSGQGLRHGASRAGRHRRMVGRRADLRERHHRAGLLRRLRRSSTTCSASTAPRAASRCPTSGSPAATATGPRQDRSSSCATATRETISVNATAAPLFLRGRRRGRGDPRRPAGILRRRA